ncbi:MAG: STAS domain-containing protein [Solirubrobacteraceae bacterium]
MVRPTKFQVQSGVRGTEATLSVAGELDMRTTDELSDHVAAQVKLGAERLTLDLRELTFIDSSGLRLLIELHDRSREVGWTLRLIVPQHEAALLVLTATGADVALPFVQAGDE